jgi:protein CrcB
MLTYALIGLGGAIGSILRAWLGTLMIALTGPAFPWGTILINILGSFVIGFFGTLTATDGRFAVPSDMRAFVMVGICGGFTTFSSFSLQTLDLLRDGRPAQAAGNIVLSVALCLGSVALGYSVAATVRTSRLAAAGEAAPGTMGNRTLLALHRPEVVQPMLTMASRLMAHEGGRVTALAIDAPALANLQPTEELMTRERAAEISARRDNWVGAMRPALDTWVAAERAKGHRARWIEVRGDGALAILEHGRSAHLLLLEHDPNDPTALARVRTALTRAWRPVLLVPSGTVHIYGPAFGRVIAVAWQEDPQARRAVRVCMPLLSKAGRVVVLHVGAGDGGDEHLPDIFGGLPTERVQVPAGQENVGKRLLALAREAGADLLVMGAYGHGRLREELFNGVTESILGNADLPVLMQPGEV